MLVYRLYMPEHAKKLDGKGDELYGSRWNTKGNQVIYGAAFRSLGYRVNNPHLVKVLVMVTIQIPETGIQKKQKSPDKIARASIKIFVFY